jgi:hypothetical protein
LSFGVLDLLGIEQMHAWYRGATPRPARLRTGLLYRWIACTSACCSSSGRRRA